MNEYLVGCNYMLIKRFYYFILLIILLCFMYHINSPDLTIIICIWRIFSTTELGFYRTDKEDHHFTEMKVSNSECIIDLISC